MVLTVRKSTDALPLQLLSADAAALDPINEATPWEGLPRTCLQPEHQGVSQNRGTILGVPMTRTVVFGVYIWVRLFWETTI